MKDALSCAAVREMSRRVDHRNTNQVQRGILVPRPHFIKNLNNIQPIGYDGTLCELVIHGVMENIY